MAITETYTGTEAIGSTEWSMTTDTAGPDSATDVGICQVFVDVNDMIAGDVLVIRFYRSVRNGDPQRLVHEWVLPSGAQAEPIWVSDSFIVRHSWDWTLQATSGTVTCNWSIELVA